MYRKAVFDQLRVELLLQSDKHVTSNDSCSELYASKPTLPSPPSLQDVASALSGDATLPHAHHLHTQAGQDGTKLPAGDATDSTASNSTTGTTTASASSGGSGTVKAEGRTSQQSLTRPEEMAQSSPLLSHKGRSPMRSPTNTGSLRRRNKSAPRNSYEDYDERAIPTLGLGRIDERERDGVFQELNLIFLFPQHARERFLAGVSRHGHDRAGRWKDPVQTERSRTAAGSAADTDLRHGAGGVDLLATVYRS